MYVLCLKQAAEISQTVYRKQIVFETFLYTKSKRLRKNVFIYKKPDSTLRYAIFLGGPQKRDFQKWILNILLHRDKEVFIFYV